MSALGFDTSNYTTSISVYSRNKIDNIRKLLPVKCGERGLRQSDALFHHIKQLPEIMDKLILPDDICAVGVSDKPRNVEGSYMPVFLAGVSFGTVAAKSMNVPLYRFSHQDGHIMAGIISSQNYTLLQKDFISVHISGGTTEILKCRFNENGFNASVIGGTKDISVGQLIDRVGVKMSLAFPCGRELEKLSQKASSVYKLPVCHNEGFFNLSGAETRALTSNSSYEDLSMGVILCISETLFKSIDYCCKKYNINDVLVVGGVASNQFLRGYLTEHCDNNILFASAELSTDNACGIAALTEFIHNGW